MKFILLLLLAFSFQAKSQVVTQRTNNSDSSTEFYVRNSPTNVIGNSRVVFKMKDSTKATFDFYNFSLPRMASRSDGAFYRKLGIDASGNLLAAVDAGGGGISPSDTASMLAPYLRKVDTTAMLSPYLRSNVASGTYATITNLALKVNISDTATMLTPYLRKIDTTAMLSPYLRSSVAAATYSPIPTVGTYSTRTGLSPSNGTEFFQTDDNRDAPAGKYYYLNSRWEQATLQPSRRLKYIFDDLMNAAASNSTDGQHYFSYNGTITAVTNGLMLGTTTSATGRVVLHNGTNGTGSGWALPSEGVMYYRCIISDLPILSTSTEEYILRIGFGDVVLGTDIQNGIYFEYDRTNSVNWRYKTANGGSRTTTTSSTAVTTGSHVLEILYTPSGTSASFWVDGVSLGAAITATIPTNSVGSNFQIVKSAGTTQRTVSVDRIEAWQRLTSDRN